MAQMLFGSGQQLWPTLPGLPFFQTLPVSRPLAGSAVNMAQGPFAAGLPITPTTPPSEVGQPIGSGWPLTSAAVASIPVQAASPEFATGVTPQALLMVVAMRRGQPMGPSTDQEIEDFICDALDLLPGTSDVEVRCENMRATLTGVVTNKRIKRDVGEIVWAIPAVNDLQNNLTIAARRRPRTAGREMETPAGSGPSRKQV